jgi:hypothetical protein
MKSYYQCIHSIEKGKGRDGTYDCVVRGMPVMNGTPKCFDHPELMRKEPALLQMFGNRSRQY